MSGQVHLLDWLKNDCRIDIGDVLFYNQILEYAAIKGHVHILQWVVDNYRVSIEDMRSLGTIIMSDIHIPNRGAISQWVIRNYLNIKLTKR